jgi:tetratricopeptide (TPR) repeat protein
METYNRQEEAAVEIDPAYSEPVTQLENTIRTVSGDLTTVISEANDCINNKVLERDEMPIEPAISDDENTEEALDLLGTTISQTDSHAAAKISEEDGACEESSDQIDNELDNNADHSAEFNESTSSTESTPKIAEIAHMTENVIGPEEEKLTKQIEINPRNATTWEALGSFYKASGRYEEAIQAFEQAVSIAPGVVSYYHNLGLVNSAAGNNEGAFNAFQKVLELDPNHSLTHASLGGYYKKIGLEELAQHHIGKAMKNIYSSENEYNRACLESICGNNGQAIKLLRTALEKKQTYVDWVLHDPDLDSLRDDRDFKQLISDFSK